MGDVCFIGVQLPRTFLFESRKMEVLSEFLRKGRDVRFQSVDSPDFEVHDHISFWSFVWWVLTKRQSRSWAERTPGRFDDVIGHHGKCQSRCIKKDNSCFQIDLWDSRSSSLELKSLDETVSPALDWKMWDIPVDFNSARILLCDLAGSERLKKSDVGSPRCGTCELANVPTFNCIPTQLAHRWNCGWWVDVEHPTLLVRFLVKHRKRPLKSTSCCLSKHYHAAMDTPINLCYLYCNQTVGNNPNSSTTRSSDQDLICWKKHEKNA